MESYQSQDITELAKALLAVQSQPQPALKDAENPFTKSSYATLNSVMDTCRAALLTNGILVTQFPVPAETGHLGLATKLIHAESGQWHSSLAVVPLPRADPPGYGSAQTYARRFALCSASSQKMMTAKAQKCRNPQESPELPPMSATRRGILLRHEKKTPACRKSTVSPIRTSLPQTDAPTSSLPAIPNPRRICSWALASNGTHSAKCGGNILMRHDTGRHVCTHHPTRQTAC